MTPYAPTCNTNRLGSLFYSDFRLAGTFNKMTVVETLESHARSGCQGNSPSPPLPTSYSYSFSSTSAKSKDNLGRVKKKKTKMEIVPDSKL